MSSAWNRINVVPPPGYELGSVQLSNVMITEELNRRGARAPDY
jgi:hypothetical protein